MPLTLTRKPREAVILRLPDGKGGHITASVRVAWIDRNTVRLTFDAPGFEVIRSELLAEWVTKDREEAP